MIRAVPAFEDNYIWIIGCDTEAADEVVVVDPGDSAPVLEDLSQRGLKLAAILITHHHRDHIGGIAELIQQAPRPDGQAQIPVYGPSNRAIAGITVPVRAGDVVEIGRLNCRLSVIEVPGHTLDHIAYFGFCASSQPVLFCGDTLFAAGCGRLFEGTAQQMWESLQKLAALPPDTAVYCTHEYTLSNLKFATHCKPLNTDMRARRAHVEQLRSEHCMTLPSSIEMELLTNPFLQCSDSKEFSVMRKQKDNFRG